ncbi:MAG: hypothetical protein M3186_04210 [Actinomycetota bacterium]|nr:hypothetical protein [Actinomycetota bacterium]
MLHSDITGQLDGIRDGLIFGITLIIFDSIILGASYRGRSKQEPDWGESCRRGREQDPDDDRGRSNDTNIREVFTGVAVVTVQVRQSGGAVQGDKADSLAVHHLRCLPVVYHAAGFCLTVWLGSPGID